MTYKNDKELIELRHRYKIEELKMERENDRLHHERDMERNRIKEAGIRRAFERKQNAEFAHSTAYK